MRVKKRIKKGRKTEEFQTGRKYATLGLERLFFGRGEKEERMFCQAVAENGSLPANLWDT